MRLALILVILAAIALVLWLSLGRSGDSGVVPEVESQLAHAATMLDDDELGADMPAAERSDAATELEPVVPVRMLRPDDPMALLRLRVVDVASRKPISGAHVTFRTLGTLPPKTPGGRPEDEAFPTTTCGEGLAVRMIEPGASWELLVVPELGTHARSSGGPLVASEERDVLVEVTTAPDGVLCGRVLARDTNLPIANAIVQIEPKHDVVAVAADGTFRAEMRSFRDEGLEVRAPGYGRRWVARAPGYESPDRALAIVLDRGASLRVEVLDSGGNPVGRVVAEIGAFKRELSPEVVSEQAGLGRSTWKVVTDGDGIAEWIDLPVGASLNGSVRRRGLHLHSEAEAIVLAAGEQRVMTWRLPVMSEIRGVVLDDGTPDPGRALWLQPSKGEREPILRSTSGEERRHATADSNGRFRFEHVTPGSWWLAPAEAAFGLMDPTRDPIPLAQLVEVPATATALDVEVRLQRGLVVRGRIATPDGSSPVNGRVTARRNGVHQLVYVRADPAGEFVLGPLLPGAWTVTATGDGLLQSDRVQVDAGTTNVILKLRPASELIVRVVDAEGLPVPSALVFVTPERLWGQQGRTNASGVAHIRELPLGPASVGCMMPDGRWGHFAGVRVELDRANEVDVVLQTGVLGTFRIVDGEARASVSILRDGAMLGVAELVAGEPAVVTLPVGRVTLRLRRGREPHPDHEVMVTAGTTPQFTFDGAWR